MIYRQACILLKFLLILLLIPAGANAAGENKEPTVVEKIAEVNRPDLEATGYVYDYTQVGVWQGVGSRLTYSFSPMVAWRFGGHALFRLTGGGETDLGYEFSVMPRSEILFRSPVLIRDFLRPYFVSELNFIYEFRDGGLIAGWSPRSGLEFFTAQQWSVSLEFGLNIPFFRLAGADPRVGSVFSLAGAYYF